MRTRILHRVVESWSTYWFKPTPLVDLAIVRIVAVGAQLGLLLFFNSLNYQYDYASLPDEMYRPIPLLQLYIWPFGLDYRPSYEVIQFVWVATVTTGILAWIGLRTNVALVLFTIGSAFLQSHQWSYGDIHNPPAVMMIGLGALSLAPSGRVLSVDALRSRTESAAEPWFARTSPFARWPLLLISWFFAFMYLSAGTSKLIASGFQWAYGDTLAYYLISDGMRNHIQSALWLSGFHGLMSVASWTALLFELTFGLALVVRKLRWIYVCVGFSFHVGVFILMRAPFFECMALYSVFVPWSALITYVAMRHAGGGDLHNLARSS